MRPAFALLALLALAFSLPIPRPTEAAGIPPAVAAAEAKSYRCYTDTCIMLTVTLADGSAFTLSRAGDLPRWSLDTPQGMDTAALALAAAIESTLNRSDLIALNSFDLPCWFRTLVASRMLQPQSAPRISVILPNVQR